MSLYFKLLSILTVLSLTACSFDHRKKVAYSLLYDQNGFEIDEVYAAAIAARFPKGTTVNELIEFTKQSEGKCFPKHGNQLTCEIPVQGHICAVRMIQIKATLSREEIQSITYFSGGFGC